VDQLSDGFFEGHYRSSSWPGDEQQFRNTDKISIFGANASGWHQDLPPDVNKSGLKFTPEE